MKAPLAVLPAVVTQANCQAALGVPPRSWLRLLRHRPGVIALGKLRGLELADALEVVRAAAVEIPTDTDEDPPSSGVEAIRRRAGLVLGGAD